LFQKSIRLYLLILSNTLSNNKETFSQDLKTIKSLKLNLFLSVEQLFEFKNLFFSIPNIFSAAAALKE
jgi:hypothetical protein